MADHTSIVSVIKCADFAAVKHKNQRRKNSEATPYINHPIGVARILAEEAGVTDPIVLQAALLHDTVESTDTTLEEIEKHFGKQIRDIVSEVTDDKSLPKTELRQRQIDEGPHKSKGAKLVKLADKLFNLRELRDGPRPGWSEEKVQEHFRVGFNMVEVLRGTNKHLEEALDVEFAKRGFVREK